MSIYRLYDVVRLELVAYMQFMILILSYTGMKWTTLHYVEMQINLTSS